VSAPSLAAELAYLVAAVCFVLALKGLSSPRTARAGNLAGAAGMVLAVLATFGTFASFPVVPAQNLAVIAAAMVVGTAAGVPAARAVPMTAIPQMVALFNGVGGGAAALVSGLEFARGSQPALVAAAVAFSAVVGAVSFSGSLLTYAKLQELMTTAPVVYPAGRLVATGLAVAGLLAAVGMVVTRGVPLLLVAAAIALAFGVALVLPVGGADVPIVISLLNAFTGLAVAASGFVLRNTLLIVAGTLVGASGTLLTRMMAAAMGRPLEKILFGAFTARPLPVGAAAAEERTVRTAGAADVAIMLAYARRVVIVPGYGLAVAQAQHTVRELADALAARGVEVEYAIHPVAGRMPGHMNVLLAEANVPYERLREMEQVNPEFARTDVALVVGANDVVNPAARTVADSPIYGMPILDVDRAASVVFLKRSLRPGFAGVENPLLYDPRTSLLFGDAKASLSAVITALRDL